MSASVLLTPKASSICLRSACLTETPPVSILLIFPCPQPSSTATSCWVIPAATRARRISLPSCLRRDVTVLDTEVSALHTWNRRVDHCRPFSHHNGPWQYRLL